MTSTSVLYPVNSQPQALTQLDITNTQTLVFAGGGNRCLWQAGLVSYLLEAGWQLPTQLVGTSAGAGVACSLMAGKVAQAVQACKDLYASNPRIVDASNLWRGRLGFAHERILPAWVASYLNDSNFESVRTARPRLKIAFARPAPLLGLHLSTLAGTLAYLVDKHISHSIHPRLPRWLGLKQGYMDLHDCTSATEAQNLMLAAAAAPPFMQARHVAGRFALDGGFVDNAPIGSLRASTDQQAVPTTLVLLTRFYPKLPQWFSWQGRNYWQPSQKVPVSTWDCTPKTTVQAAFDLGLQDARHALVGLRWR